MSIFRGDRIQEKGTGSGTGAITLTGTPPTSYKTVAAAGMTNGQQATFLIIDDATAAWEISLCTYNSGAGTLTRDTFKSGSTGATFIIFAAGIKTIAQVPAASDVVTNTDGLNMAARVDVASATPNIGAAAGNHIRLTGTTAITAFDTATAGYWRWLEFEGALTLTHDGTNIDIYGGVSVTTQAKMMALAIYITSTLVRVWVLPATVATAANVWLGTENFKYCSPKSLMDAAAPVALAYGATVTLDMTTGFSWEIGALTGNLTLANPSAGMTPGRSGAIGLLQDGTGSRTLTLGSQWKHVGGAPTLSTAINAQDVLYYYVVSASVIRCSLNKAFA